MLTGKDANIHILRDFWKVSHLKAGLKVEVRQVQIRLLPHHNNVRTTTVVVVVVHTPHSILKNDSTCTIICTSKCTVQMMPNPKKLKNFLEFFGSKWTFEQYIFISILSAGAVAVQVWKKGSVHVWTTTTLNVECGNSLFYWELLFTQKLICFSFYWVSDHNYW